MATKQEYLAISRALDWFCMLVGYGILIHKFGIEIALMVFFILGSHEIGSARLVHLFLSASEVEK